MKFCCDTAPGLAGIGVWGLLLAGVAGTTGAGEWRFYDVGFEADVPFLGPERTERLDLYFPRASDPRLRFPAVVIIHGGGWVGGDKGDAREINIGSNLARAGYVCVSINYVLARKGRPTWPENLYDCKRAVQFLRVNADRLRVLPDRIGCIGGSAGGHLAAMLGVCGPDAGLEPPRPYPGVSSRVQAAVDMYGIADLAEWRFVRPDGTPTGRRRRGAQTTMLGETWKDAPDLWRQASPAYQASPGDAPILILHGTADTVVDYLQSVNFARRLEALGLPHEFHLIEGARHTFDLRPQGIHHVDVRRIVLSFFDRHLKGLSKEQAESRYAALLDFEKADPRRAAAGRWTCGAGVVESVRPDGSGFRIPVNGESRFVTVEPCAEFVVERPGTLDEVKNGSLVLLRGVWKGDVFHASAVLRFPRGRSGWQFVREDRMTGRWRRLRTGDWWVTVGGKKQKVVLDSDVDVIVREKAAGTVLKPGASIVRIEGKQFGTDLYASRIVVRAPARPTR